MQFSGYFILNAFVSVLILCFIAGAIIRRRESPYIMPFIGMCVCVFIAIFFTALSMLLLDFNARTIFHELKFVGMAYLPVVSLYLYTNLSSYGSKNGVTTKNSLSTNRLFTKSFTFTILVIPTLTVIFALTNRYHQLFREELYIVQYGGYSYVASSSNIWFWINLVYSYLLLLASFIIFLILYIRRPSIYRGQQTAILIGTTITLAFHVASVLNLYNDYGDLSVTCFAISLACQYWGLLLYKPTRMIRMARELSLSQIKDLVLIFDINDVLIDANLSAVSAFGLTSEDYGRKRISDFKLCGNPDMVYEIGGASYGITDKALCDEKDDCVGRALYMKDITKVRSAVRELESIASYDYLTGYCNRHAFINFFKNEKDYGGIPVTIICINIERTRFTNSLFGNQTGDKVIKLVGKTVFDICVGRKGARFARLDEDEYGIIMPDTQAAGAEAVIADVKAKINDRAILKAFTLPSSLKIDISAGYAIKHEKKQDLETIYKSALEMMRNKKLLNSKNSGLAAIGIIKELLYTKEYSTPEHNIGYIRELAVSLGKAAALTAQELASLELLIEIHDVGMLLCEDELDDKKTGEELKHSAGYGYKIALSIPQTSVIAEDILSQYEWYDGSGYPNGLKAEQIPKLSRILAIINMYEKIRDAGESDVAAQLREYRGTRLDPYLLDLFLNLVSGNNLV